VALGLVYGSASAPAARRNVWEAVEHMTAAVKEWKLGNTEMLVEHVDGALHEGSAEDDA
jgi:hypothetical protein